ncbi:hypothetical protein HHI36_023108 [Cryptolaemus montrouzieri]|uniref:RNase H type-1 domain-containing protein n=1 Tax=Cryptolaemus montrouzieri TaxID=559131 RepID=A0ABD2PFC4_9CUCU
MSGIERVVTEITRRNIIRSIIISDSLIAIQKLKNTKWTADIDIRTDVTKNKLYEAKELGFNIVIIWVPSQSYIHHNDMADILANRGRLFPNSPNIKGGSQELGPEYKKIIKRKWMEEFRNLAETKGKVYFEYFKFLNLGTEGWYHGMDRP